MVGKGKPAPVRSPRRVWAPGISRDALPHIDAVLLSHNNYDHIDIANLRRLNAKHGPPIVTPLGNDAILQRAFRGVRVAAGNWWDCIDGP
jgi:L-ascorbate metabolism protein UlaG (beta-lactamase superfamily)